MRGVPARRLVAVVLLCLVGAGARATAGDAPAAPLDPENPRNVRFEGPIVETVRATPRVDVRGVGDRSAWPEGTDVRFEVVARRLPSSAPAAPAGTPEDEPLVRLDGGFRAPVGSPAGPYYPWKAESGRHVFEVVYGTDRGTFATDSLRVLLLVERKTDEDGEKRFGSFVRRFRKSLDDLHALFAASVHPESPQGVLDRFRVEEVRVYDRDPGGHPPRVPDLGEFDLLVACDETSSAVAPPAGAVRGRPSFLHTFPGRGGIWSSWGEQGLWYGLLFSRGLPRLSDWVVLPGALPGRFAGPIPLPERFARDLLASPFQAPSISQYTAMFANLRRGIGRPGDPEDPEDARFGHVWNFLPGRVVVTVHAADSPAARAVVRWWRALPTPREAGDPVPGVAADRAPDGEATADAHGHVMITGDYLGRQDAPARRSRWLLVEVRRGGERRFEILYGLDLNVAYARGAKYVHGIAWDFERLIPVGATSLPNGR